MLSMPKEITICEVSTRDGFQSLPFEIEVDDKLKLLEMIAESGIREIEVGSIVPGRSASLFQMAKTPEVFRKMRRHEGVVYRALLQTPQGAQEAVDCGCGKFKINISGSQKHYELMTGKTIEEGIKGFREIGRIAADNHVAMLGSISLAFMSPYDGQVSIDTLKKIIKGFVEECGAAEISLNDTAGMATPVMVREYFVQMMEEFPQIERWAFHPHNTRGMGLANTIAALDAGVCKVDSSLAGIGGCSVFKNASGNIATEDLLYLLDGMGVETGVSMEKVIKAGIFVEELVKGHSCDSYIQRLEKIKKEQKTIE